MGSTDTDIESAARDVTPPRVTVLAGFLGAGKTTLLNHLLSQAEGRRWAAVVNDLAAINVDGAIVRAGAGDRQVVELGNGCVCCSSRDDLAEALAELAATGDYEHILVETTGVAEPRAVANLFVQRNPFGRTLAQFATLSALVTVLDTPAAAKELAATEDPVAPAREAPAGGVRPVFELMIEQLECADIVVLNKTDLATPEEQAQVRARVAALNPRAEVIEAEYGQVASEVLLDRVRFDPRATLSGAAWIRALNAVAPAAAGGPAGMPGRALVRRPTPPKDARPSHETKFGITSFVYQARGPFVRERFRALIAQGLPGLLRAKGFYWEREQPDEMGFLSVAGGVARFDFLNYWWAALVENGKARVEDRPATVVALWQEPHGDRRQELVFIGVGLDEAAIRAQLDKCLVHST